MPTKLSKYCDGIMEAAWLAAVIVVPVFFDIFSSRIFEPDKLTLLRTLALVILAAWLVKLFAQGGIRWDRVKQGRNLWETIRNTPLILPVLALALVYILSTIFSVSPRTSLLGSYQRLQGTYTTFSYVVIFAAIIGNLRRRSQVERILTVAIIASLPVSLYGYLQRIKLDPIPWGGDVSSRIAANLGNSIFVAAYLIMVIPLTSVRIIQSFWAILSPGDENRNKLVANMVRATFYILILAFEIIALYFSGSRGPWLGWFTSLVFLGLVTPLIWRLRWVTFATVGVAVVAGIFLLVLNIPNGPLENLRSVQGIGRLGQIFDAESRTGRVRALIWQGAVELVMPHQPLEFPDGRKDSLNALRPLIGYGPESMYVAYNPFYQPELTQVEKRNASPDRSHNETWDSLVITGLLGLFVYLFLFGSVFYFGLKWLGLLTGRRQRNLFLALFLTGGVVGATIMAVWKGPGYFGVGLPFGIIIGVMVYIGLVALFGRYEVPPTPGSKLRMLTLMGLLAVIVAHFVEINFGIAIAVTRTYFWMFSGLLLVVGYIFPFYGEYGYGINGFVENNASEIKELEKQPGEEKSPSGVKKNPRTYQATSKKRRRGAAVQTASTWGINWPDWLREALIAGLIVGIILITLGYNYITNAQGGKTTLSVLITSLVQAKTTYGTSAGLIIMILTSWLVGSFVLASEWGKDQTGGEWLKVLGVGLLSSILVGFIYYIWQSSSLANLANQTANSLQEVLVQISRYENMLTQYYVFLLLILVGLAFVFFLGNLEGERVVAAKGASWVAAGISVLIVLFLASYTNLRVVQADIAFKLAEPFTKSGQWPVAIEIYNRAKSLAPNEDYYYLFLGRAYIEHAKTLSDPTERDQFIEQAANDLRKAQAISPLNTDHTANLARLYSLWSSFSSDPKLRDERAKTSADYFSRAVVLSPQNARIWDEWALLNMNIMNDNQKAFDLLSTALKIDPFYDWTYGLLGDYYAKKIGNISDTLTDEQRQNLQTAEQNYQSAIKYVLPGDVQKFNYLISDGNVQAKLGQLTDAINSYQQALSVIPSGADGWQVEETIARMYYQIGDKGNAILHAQNALASAPDNQKSRIQSLINQLSG